MAKVTRPGLFTREIKERLSLAAFELLLSSATRLDEGQVLPDGHFFGSSMITMDLAAAAEIGLIGEANPDVTTAMRLARLLGENDAAQDRLRAMAHAGAIEQAGGELLACELDVRIRAEGLLVFIDVDVEARRPSQVAGGETVG